jgi:cytochrome c556
VPDIKEIMSKANKPGGFYFALVRDLKDDEPPWDDVQAGAKALNKLAAVLGKNTPPKGDKTSWDQLTKAYADNAKALEAAALKKDKKAAQTAATALGESCNACHKAHRK